jgi:hypothetical protein
MRPRTRLRFLAACALILCWADVRAERPASDNDGSPYVVPIPRIEGLAVQIDGFLDEEVWNEAALFRDFSLYLPIDGRRAVDSTNVLVWYSPTAIHFGIQAFEIHGEVRATLADRDKIGNDDHVLILLDTYNDRRQAVIIGVNPLGQQADGVLRDSERGDTGSTGAYSIDLSPDFVYQSRGRVTEYGYEIEVRVPFKSLRYQAAFEQDWGFNVIRKIQHSGYTTTWTQVRQSTASFMAQGGQIMQLTDLRRGLVLDINPELTGSVTRPEGQSAFDTEMQDPLGVNVRWGISNNFTLNGSVNPDFSQVEADVAQLQFDPREAVFFPEKRPFFLDGIELFESPTELVYTRRIANPASAIKFAGKAGRTNVAVLSAVDNRAAHLSDLDARYFNVLRLRQDLRDQSTIGLTYTDKIDGSLWNRVAAVDGRLVFSRDYSVVYQSGLSFTGDGVSRKSAPMWKLVAGASGRRLGLTFLTTGFHPDFEAGSGFINRVGIVRGVLAPRVRWFGIEGATIESFTGGITLDGRWDYDDFEAGHGPNDRKFHINTSYRFRGGWSGNTNIFYESFKYPEELYTDYFVERRKNGVPVDTVAYVGTDRLTNIGFWSELRTPRLSTLSANLFVVAGRDDNFFEWAPADIFFTTVDVNWNPTEQLRFELRYNHQQYIRADDKSTVGLRRVPRLKVEYQMTPFIFLRLVGQYDSNFVDELRDNSRTDDPILILDRESGEFRHTRERRSNRFRVDWLFSFRPNPGTVIFFGYGTSLSEPSSFRFRNLRRTSDGFFLKLSYLLRV